MQHAQPYPPHIFTVTGLAKYANTSKNTILAMIYSGKLAAFALNPESPTRKNWRIRNVAWEAFISAQKSSQNGP
jgi:hypothetical protein